MEAPSQVGGASIAYLRHQYSMLITEFQTTSPSQCLTIWEKDKYSLEQVRDNISIDTRLCYQQGFAWHPEYIVFFTLGQSQNYWVEIYLADDVQVDPAMEVAIRVPFTRTKGMIELTCIDIYPLDLPVGSYQLLYENRLLEPEDWKNYEHFKDYDRADFYDELDYPELCRFTFVPTEEPAPPTVIKGSRAWGNAG